LVVMAACQGGVTAPAGGPSAAPEPLDCDAIAEDLASIELGNYAPRPAVARVVEHERADCAAAGLSDAERACVAAARTREAAEACAPRLVLDVECDAAVGAVRAARRRPGVPPAFAAQLDREFAVMTRACDEDDWPVDVKRCLVGSASFEACAGRLPRPQQAALAKRLAAELER
jgi:hypothetical protein